MERLRGRDLRALLDMLRETYALRDLDGFVEHLLSALPKIVGSEITSYHEMLPEKTKSENWVNPAEINTPARDQAWERVMHQHPVLAHQVRAGDGRAFKISDFLTRPRFHDLALYTDFYRPMGVADVLATFLPHSPPLVIGIAVHRDRPNFSERDRLLLNLLRPHLAQAHRNARMVTRLRQGLMLGQQIVETDQGVIVLTCDKRVRLMSARARRWLAEYFGGRGERLPDTLRRWVEHQEGLLRTPSDVPPPREPLVVGRDAKRLVVRLLFDSAQTLLLLAEQRTALQPSRRERFGLTRCESEVLAWVTEGKTNADIGTILGTSPRTVQKHLEHIYQKLGVETRTAAAARALQAAGSIPA